MRIKILYFITGLLFLGNVLMGQTISVQPEDVTACSGAFVNFSVIVSGTAPISYQWQRDTVTGSWHNLPGEVTNNTTVTADVNGNKNNTRFRVVITDGNSNTIISDSAFLYLANTNVTLNHTENSGASSNDWTICSGDPISLITGGGMAGDNYEFFVNGVSQQSGTSTTYVPNPAISAFSLVYVVLTQGTCTFTSPTRAVYVNPTPNTTLTYNENSGAATNDGMICAGDPVTFTVSGAANNSTFEFFVNGVPSQSGTSNSFTPNPALTANATITATTSRNVCSFTNPGITITVTNSNPGITYNENSGVATNDGIMCAGDPITFTGTGGAAGATYDFYLNGTSVQNGTSSTYTPSPALQANANVQVAITSNGCSGTSPITSITVNAYPNAGISFNENSGAATNDGIICQGAAITFTGTGGAGGANYEFFVNNVSAQNGASNSYTPIPGFAVNSDVYVVITQNGCIATSPTQSITVTSGAIPTLTFTESSGVTNDDGIICSGAPVTFTAAGGSGSATYEFFANGTSVQNGTSNTYLSNLNTNTTVTVSLTDAGCTAPSTGVTITIFVPSNPVLTFSENSGLVNNDGTICSGDPVMFTITGPSAGSNYNFFINGVSSQNSTSNTFTPSPALTSNSIVFATITEGGCDVVSPGAQINVTTPTSPGLTFVEHSGIASNDGIICSGYAAAVFTATGGNSGANYEFFVNGTSAQSGASNTYTPNPGFTINSTVTVTLTENGCSDTHAGVNITVTTGPASILNVTETSGTTANDGIICAGDPVTLIASGGAAGSIYDFFNGATSVQSGTSNMYIPTPALTSSASFTVTVFENNCGTTSSPTNVTVNPIPTPMLTFTESSGVANNDGIICAGHAVTFTASGGVAGANYEFFLNGTSAQSGTSNTYIPSPAISTNSNVTVTISQNGCVDSSTPVSITTNPSPASNLTFAETSGVANDDGLMCEGDPITFTASGAGAGGTYEFFLNGTSVQTGTSTTYTPNPALTSNAMVSVTTVEFGCDATSVPISITVNPIPSANLTFTEASGNTLNDGNICIGDSVTFTAVGGGSGATYAFLVNGTVMQTSQSNVFISGLAANANVTVRIIENGCENLSGPISISVSNKPNAGMNVMDTSGITNDDGAVCPGDPVTFTGTGGTAYGFFLNGTAQGLPSSNSVYTLNNPTQGDQVYVLVINGNGCFVDGPVITVTVNTIFPTLTKTIGDTICAGESSTFIAGGGSHYTFYNDVDSNGVYVSSEVVQFRSQIPTFISTNLPRRSRIVALVEDAAVGCESFSAAILINTNPLPDPQFVLGPDQVCEGELNVRYCLAQAYVNHVWTLNSSPIIGGVQCNTFNFNVGTGINTIAVEVTDEYGCKKIQTKPVWVNPLPVVSITNPGPLCINQSPVNLGETPSGGVFMGVGITDTVDGIFDPVVSGPGNHIITYSYTDVNGCFNMDSDTIQVLLAPTADFIFDTSIPCKGLPTQFSDQSTGATTYLWTFPDGVISTDQNPKIILPKRLPDTNFVRLIIRTGDCRDTVMKTVFINPNPKADFGFDRVCFTNETNYSNKSRRDDAVFNTDKTGLKYIWDFDGETVSIEDEPAYAFTERKSPRTVTLIVENDFGCIDTLVQNNIELNLCGPAPYIKKIAKDGDPGLLLVALDSTLNVGPEGLTYQWYKKDTGPISDNGNRQFYFIQDFNELSEYYVEVRAKDGVCPCIGKSSRLAVPANPIMYGQGMTISPNPNTGAFLVDIVHPIPGAGRLEIIDAVGRVVYEASQEKTEDRLHLSFRLSLPAGMYFVRYYIGGALRETEKMIVK